MRRFDRLLPWVLVTAMMAALLMGIVWDASFEATPANTDLVSQGDDRIRDLKAETRTRTQYEHCFGSSGGSGCVTDSGAHREGSGRAFYEVAAPANLLNPTAAVIDTLDDDGRLWVDSDGAAAGTYDDRTLNVWTGSAWAIARAEAIVIPGATINAATIDDSQILDIGTIDSAPYTLLMTGGAGAGGLPMVTAPATGTWLITVAGNFVVNRSGIVSTTSERKFVARLQEQVAAGAFATVAWCDLTLLGDDNTDDPVGACTFNYGRAAAASTAYTYRIRVSIFAATADTDDIIIDSASANHDVEAETSNTGYLRIDLGQRS